MTGKSTRSTRHGYNFESEIRKALSIAKIRLRIPAYVWKIPDTHAFDRYHKRATGDEDITVLMPKVPCDFLFLSSSVTMMIECKSSKQSRVNLRQLIKAHQWAMCIEMTSKGICPYLFFIEDRRFSTHNRCYVMTLDNMLELYDYLDMYGFTTASWLEVSAYAFMSIRQSRGSTYKVKYDLRKFIERMVGRNDKKPTDGAVRAMPTAGHTGKGNGIRGRQKTMQEVFASVTEGTAGQAPP